MSVTQEVGDFIASELLPGRNPDAPAPDDDLLAKGLVDSHGVMELVTFLEERYSISVGDDDLTPGQIEELVARKRG